MNRELQVCANFAHTAADGKQYETNFVSDFDRMTELPFDE